MPGTSESTQEYTFLLTAGEQEPLHVRFEPVGPEYEIRPGDYLRVGVANSPSDDPVEVTAGANWVTVWAAPGVKLRATTAGGEKLRFLL